MLSKQENELLERVDKGQPMGELFRRFWLPALLKEELLLPDSPPVRVRLLGEDLVAFRDSDGRVGIVDAFCPHRNAPLFFGRNEESGIRCVYHGWKFDVEGRCLDMPNCEEGPQFKDRVHLQAYPTLEGAGMVWVYMGPADKVPPPPGFDWFGLPDDHVFVTKYFVQCNYLQTLENEFDSTHSAFLHRTLNPAYSQSARVIATTNPAINMANRNILAPLNLYDTDYGAASGRVRDDNGTLALSSHFMMPCFSTAGAVSAAGTHPINAKIPVDDLNTVFFRLKWSAQPIQPDVIANWKTANHEFPEQIPGSYTTKANRTNDYLIDRNLQRFFNYTGMNPYPVQDFAVVENQRGPLADRSREVLTSSDRYIIHVRRRLAESAKALMQGQEPLEPWRPEAYAGIRNFMTVSEEMQSRLRPVYQGIAVEASTTTD
jgi:phenylpropionate dioxygenase-like ring-hydroxylating dioxygenase large terminal subunit